ncbi:hypothetical protein AGDE_01904 [Angomonas deanei]|nr:hypothetical protein AGDE_01904 [Angomonas deanei]|eukprot:EPY42019.1 hypothetical protein AGDE_01904 [Angomonas deanei]
MVFYSFVIVLKPLPRLTTAQTLKELTNLIYTHKGQIRHFSNEGYVRPYHLFRDVQQSVLTHVRYITLDVDMGETETLKVEKLIKEHNDVQIVLRQNQLENPLGLKNNKFLNKNNENNDNQQYFPLDTFTRLESEIHWSPQVSGDVYEQLDKNWKEFSRTRWSNYLRN